jgi:hypothetical protein
VNRANRADRVRNLIQRNNRQSHRARNYKPPTQGLHGIYASQYEGNVNNLLRDRQAAQANAGFQQQQTQQSFGLYGPYADPKTNPYSQAAQLQARLSQANKTSLNSYAAHGQLYAGSMQNATNANVENYNRGYNELATNYTLAMNKIREQRNAAKQTFREGKVSAKGEAIQNQLKEDLDTTAAPRSPYKSQKFYNRRGRRLRHRLHQLTKGRNG